MAPYSPKGDPLSDGRPDLAAHVINNSWGCPKREGCRPAEFAQAARALKAAGVLVVVSAGNDGPNCSTIDSPAATWPDVFTVGASTRSDGITSFSSRGPVTADGSNRVKPDISAPGSGVRSALPGNRYANLDGTSMAGPVGRSLLVAQSRCNHPAAARQC